MRGAAIRLRLHASKRVHACLCKKSTCCSSSIQHCCVCAEVLGAEDKAAMGGSTLAPGADAFGAGSSAEVQIKQVCAPLFGLPFHGACCVYSYAVALGDGGFA